MCTGFTFSQPVPRLPPRMAGQGPSASRPRARGAMASSRNSCAAAGSDTTTRGVRCASGTSSASSSRTLGARPVQHVVSVDVQDVEDEQAQRDARLSTAAGRTASRSPGTVPAARQDAKRSPRRRARPRRPATHASPPRSPARARSRRRGCGCTRARRRRAGGPARVRRRASTPPPPRRAAQRVLDVLRRARQHRAHRPPDLEPEPIERGGARPAARPRPRPSGRRAA